MRGLQGRTDQVGTAAAMAKGAGCKGGYEGGRGEQEVRADAAEEERSRRRRKSWLPAAAGQKMELHFSLELRRQTLLLILLCSTGDKQKRTEGVVHYFHTQQLLKIHFTHNTWT